MAEQLLVFISYSRNDTEIAYQLTEVLEKGQHRPWIDNQLVPGQRWREKIEQAIEDCDAFLFLLSPTSIASEYCQWEYEVAIEKKKPIFPVIVKSFGEKFPEELADLAEIQYVDMSDGLTAANTAALVGGVFRARPVTQTKIPLKRKESLPPRPIGYQGMDAFPTANELNITPDPLDGTEPMTRLPLPNENPLPRGVTASISIVQSPTLGPIMRAIHSTTYTIGRAPTMTLPIPEKRVSKHHLTIYWANSRFFVVDYSLNGTWVNGERIQNNRPVALDVDFVHRLDLAKNNTVLNFKYITDRDD